MNNNELLKVENIYGGYGEVKVLFGAELEVKPGEVVSIIGPNGSGKSTLMKTIFGLLHPDRGQVNYKGENIAGMEPFQIIRKGIGYIPQENNVFPSLTVEENLEMGAYIMEESKQIKKNMERVFELFPSIKNRRRTPVYKLSGGTRQMVACARGLMLEPSLLLFDEPSAGLAPKLVEDVKNKLKEINETGTSLLIVEQNVQLAFDLCDRGYVLNLGETVIEGSGQELMADEKVKDIYMGSLN